MRKNHLILELFFLHEEILCLSFQKVEFQECLDEKSRDRGRDTHLSLVSTQSLPSILHPASFSKGEKGVSVTVEKCNDLEHILWIQVDGFES